MKPIDNDMAGRDVPDGGPVADKASLSYRAGYDAFRAGKALADDPRQLFESWEDYQIGYIDAMAEAIRAINVRGLTVVK